MKRLRQLRFGAGAVSLLVSMSAALIASSTGPSSVVLGETRLREVAPVSAPAHRRPAPRERQVASRVRSADVSRASALFATHSWYVAPPPPPPVAAPAPPPPQAPPFPYTFVGSYAPAGAAPVYFLARADRVIDAHVGDKLDGVYAFESAASGSLVFNYLPLNIRQSVPIGAVP